MRRHAHPPLLLLLACLLAATSACAQRDLQNLQFETKRFQSKALGSKHPYGVYLPKGYDKDKAGGYPLIVFLHGMWEDHRRFEARGGGRVLDRLVGNKTLPPMVFVCANGNRSSFYVNGKKSGRYEDMVVKDLIQHITKTYAVSTEQSRRAILGVSMGGWGALKIAFRHPKVFGVVAAHSAALLPSDPDLLEEQFPWIRRGGFGRKLVRSIFGKPVDRKMWRAENPVCLAAKLTKQKLGALKIYFDCGTKDRYGFHRPNRDLHKTLQKKGIRHEWRSVPGGGHGWRSGYNGQALKHSLQFIAKTWATKRATKALGGLMGGSLGGKPAKKAGKPTSKPARQPR